MKPISTFQYHGYVLPTSFNGVEDIRKPIEKFDASQTLILRIELRFQNNDFCAKAEIFDPRIDVTTGRNAVQDIVYDIVDAWGFQLAIGCHVIISHCIRLDSGDRVNFGPHNQGLRKRIDEFGSDLTASEIAAVLRHRKGFYLSSASRDIANSHRYLIKDLPFYCRRATESCMRFLLDINQLDPDEKKNEPKGWHFLENATSISTEEYLQVKKLAADKIRHGSNAEFSAMEELEMLRIAWESVHACLVIGREKFVIRDNS